MRHLSFSLNSALVDSLELPRRDRKVKRSQAALQLCPVTPQHSLRSLHSTAQLAQHSAV